MKIALKKNSKLTHMYTSHHVHKLYFSEEQNSKVANDGEKITPSIYFSHFTKATEDCGSPI